MTFVEECYVNYVSMIESCDGQIERLGNIVPIPFMPVEYVDDICKAAIHVIQYQPVLIYMMPTVVVVGDLHGNLVDLVRIFLNHGLPPKTTYLFLGDYVDRGRFSIEVILMLLTLKCRYPNDIILLRGNHEFADVNARYGFLKEVQQVYGNDHVYNIVNEVFSYLPFAAVVGNDIFCVHGGIGSDLSHLNQIAQLKLPINDGSSSFLKGLLWSDPAGANAVFESSIRGESQRYGGYAVRSFFDHTKMKWIIRGHQCVQHGIKHHELGNVITVFSSSSYNGSKNKAGVLIITKSKDFQTSIFPPLESYLTRENAIVYTITKVIENKKILISKDYHSHTISLAKPVFVGSRRSSTIKKSNSHNLPASLESSQIQFSSKILCASTSALTEESITMQSLPLIKLKELKKL